MLDPTGKPCKECPFRRKSLAGYLGNDTPDHFAAIALIGEEPMPCHLAVDYSDPDWKQKLDMVPQCSGFGIFLTHNCKSPRNPEVKTLPANKRTVLGSVRDWIAHHGGSLKGIQRQFIRIISGEA